MTPAPRRPWIAALLAVLCSGLGHLYAASLRAAVTVFLLSLVVAVSVPAAMRLGPAATIAAAAAGLAFWVGQAVHAARVAARRAGEPRTRASHPLALLAFYVATVAVSNVLLPSFRTHVAQTIYVPSGSMIPTVQTGDYLVVASGPPRNLRGAVVVHDAPAGSPRTDAVLKRVVAVAGDTVELRDGALVVNGVEMPRSRVAGPCKYAARSEDEGWREEPCVAFEEKLDGRAYRTYCTPYLPCGDVPPLTVPEGTVWVAGDHRDHSADSRVYGPVPVRMIQGEVRWVIASWGPAGLRWDRFGLAIR